MTQTTINVENPGGSASCPYCNINVSAKRLESHKKSRCPKSPMVLKLQNKTKTGIKKPKKDNPTSTIIRVRARLEKLFRELENGVRAPDEVGLAREFKAFYYMYVWQGTGQHVKAARAKEVDLDGTPSISIRTVSGGLPSLGKNSR